MQGFFVKYFNGKSNGGYHNRTTGFRSYFISFDDGSRLEIMSKPNLSDDAKELNRTGYIHLAFSVGSKEKVDELTARLKNDGYGYYESCILGIENNQIEITV